MSITRSAPKRCWRPSVALKTPPLRPTSWPSTQTRSSRSISSWSASRTAWTSVRSGIGVHVSAQRARFRLGCGLRHLGRLLDLAIDVVTHRLIGLRRKPATGEQCIAHPWNGIPQRLRSELSRVTVGSLVVVGGMGLQAQDLGFDQGRPTPGPRALRRFGDGGVYRKKIVAADSHAGNAVGGRPFRHAGTCHLQRLRHRDRPVVVLAEKDHRAVMDGGEVQTFVEVALAGRPLAKTDVAEGALPFPLQGQADPSRLGDLGTDSAGSDHDAAAAAAEVARSLASATRRVGGAGEGGKHQFLRSEAAGQRGGEISIVETEAIAPRLQRGHGGDLRDLMPTWRNDESQLAGAVQDEATIVERTGPQHGAIRLEHALFSQSLSVGGQP